MRRGAERVQLRGWGIAAIAMVVETGCAYVSPELRGHVGGREKKNEDVCGRTARGGAEGGLSWRGS